jgi:hypothetical protein
MRVASACGLSLADVLICFGTSFVFEPSWAFVFWFGGRLEGVSPLYAFCFISLKKSLSL